MTTAREQLKRAMQVHDISQRRLAHAAGVTESQVSLYVRGKRDVTTATLDKLLAGLAELTREAKR